MRYFFHFQSEAGQVEDETGEEFGNDLEAVAHARQIAAELTRNVTVDAERTRSVRVVDSRGYQVIALAFPLTTMATLWRPASRPFPSARGQSGYADAEELRPLRD